MANQYNIVISLQLKSINLNLKKYIYTGKWGKTLKKHNKAGITILITDKVELKSKSIQHNKAGHLLMAHVSIHNENITCMSIYSSFNTIVTL